MLLDRIDIDEHGPLRRVELGPFSEQLNVVLGPVGSGKTVVAALAALQPLEADCQVALMAPTEILAEQHFKTLFPYEEKLDIRVELLTGATTQKRRNPFKSHAHGYFAYTKQEMCAFGEKNGYRAEYIGHWDHPRQQVIVRYTLNNY